MPNTVQLKKNGQPVFPVTDVSLVMGLAERPLMDAVYAWDGTGTPDITKIPAGVTVEYNTTTYTGTLAASADTTARFYLVPSTTVPGEYDRYLTDAVSGSYSWKSAGTTAIPTPSIVDNLESTDPTKALSAKQGKVLNEELGELEAKVDDLQTGKYYGYFAQEEDLPETGVDGFAYVGQNSPYTIYNLRGGVWTSSEITVNQSPIGNDEDIDQNEDGKLQFANRVYNAQQPNGMGYKILRKDATFASQVTDTNTIYEIRYPFNLNGATFTIPSGCVLYFNGGMMSNGSVNFNGSKIESESQCFEDIVPTGLHLIRAEWFGITPESVDISTKFNALFASLTEETTVVFKPEIYTTSATLTVSRTSSSDENSISIIGDPIFFTTSASTPCVSLTGLNRTRQVFRVRRSRPTIWANTDSIGALLVNIEHSDIRISDVRYFTYGIVCRAQGGVLDGGFAWNNIYCNYMVGVLQAFVVESVQGGWPNANTFRGGLYMGFHSSFYDATNAQNPVRAIVFKTDGQYGANGWTFSGLCIEGNASAIPEIGGRPFIPIDFCDYVGGTSVFESIKIDGRFETPGVTALVKVKSSSFGTRRRLFLSGTMIASGVKTAIDENGNNVTGLLVQVVGYNYLDKVLGHFKYEDAGDDLVSTTRMSLGKRFYGIQLYGTLSETYGQFGYANKGQVYENIAGAGFTVYRHIRSTFTVHFLDENLAYVDASSAKLYPLGGTSNPMYIREYTGSYKNFWASQAGMAALSFCIGADTPAKYMVIAVENGGEIEVRQVIDPDIESYPETKVCYPLGIYPTNAFVANKAFSSLRAKFNSGDRYLDETTNKVYQILKAGSVGSIDITVTGDSGANTVTASATTNLLVGDYVTIDGHNYIVRGINGTTKVITLNGTLPNAVSSVPMTLTAPTYTTIPV